MRVLLVASPAFYNNQNEIGSPYHGGGWMYTIQKKLIENPEIELGICFRAGAKTIMDEQNGVHYYAYSQHIKSFRDKILDLLNYNDPRRDQKQWKYYVDQARIFIDDFKPDIIHIFGSETYNQLISLVGKEKKIPTILHIQGILTLCQYSILPPEVSAWTYCLKDGIKKIFPNFQELINWKRSVYREKAILSSVPYVSGRTEWDKHAMSLLAPHAEYKYGGEILRPEFYVPSERKLPRKLTIVSISSNPLYKGFDIILKTAQILRNELYLDFEWKVYGNVTSSFWEKHLHIKHEDVCVSLCGVADASTLREALLTSTLYFQSSYIENSPNSVAEAQILGIPVVATNVGGTSSLVEHGSTGFLFPVIDPYMAVYYINLLYNDLKKNRQIGEMCKQVAMKRHDIDSIMNDLLLMYKEISSSNV